MPRDAADDGDSETPVTPPADEATTADAVAADPAPP